MTADALEEEAAAVRQAALESACYAMRQQEHHVRRTRVLLAEADLHEAVMHLLRFEATLEQGHAVKADELNAEALDIIRRLDTAISARRGSPEAQTQVRSRWHRFFTFRWF